MYIICNSQSINQSTIQYLASQISQSINHSNIQSVNQTVNQPFQQLVDPEMSAVLFCYASHQALLFSLASNHFFIQDSQPFIPSIKQSIKNFLYLEQRYTRIFQCYPNVLISQLAVHMMTANHDVSDQQNFLVYRYGSLIELFIRFKEYYGTLRGHVLSTCVNFLGKKRTSVYISREKGDHHYIQTWHNDFFGYYNLFLEKLKEKLALKARINSIWLPYQ